MALFGGMILLSTLRNHPETVSYERDRRRAGSQ